MSRRALLRLALAAPLASGVLAAPAHRTIAAPDSVRPTVNQRTLGPEAWRRLDTQGHRDETLGVTPHGRSTRPDSFTTGRLGSEPFRLAALTWTGTQRPALLLRTRDRRGRWSEWTRLSDDGHAPDPTTAEARTARRGTDAVVTGESDAVEVRTEGTIPDDLRLELIHPGTSPADAARGAGLRGTTAAAPDILRRADWGADESLRESGDPRYGQVRGAFVHHTAGSNSYSEDDVPGIIRSIYAYHVEGRGWRDIGYNFIVDKFGRIWEGRFGGIERPVVGAHVAGYNYYAFGTSVLGTYVNNEPAADALDAFARVIAWKFLVHDVDPTRVTYPDLTDVPAIAGHREGGATECPGDRLYDRLTTIRTEVARILRAH